MTKSSKKDCIVLDTNSWLPDHLLRIRMSASLLHIVVQRDARIGFPEVLDRELRKQSMRIGQEALDRAQASNETLRAMFGTEVFSNLPSADLLEDTYEKRIAELNKYLIRVPITLNQVRRSLARIIDHLPPSGPKNEQFRDSMIWEAVLDLANKFDVYFVTADKAFYQNRETKNGLALNLLNDCKEVSGNIFVYPTVRECVEALRKDIQPIDDRHVAETVADAIRDEIAKKISEIDYILVGMTSYSVKLFETGRPALTLSYTLTFDLASTRPIDTSRRQSRLITSGACVFDPRSRTVAEIHTDSDDIEWTDSNGKIHRARRDIFWPTYSGSFLSSENIDWTTQGFAVSGATVPAVGTGFTTTIELPGVWRET